MSVRAVLFDFDFTLGDSADAIVHCSRAAFTDMGLTPAEPAAIRRTIGLTLQASFHELTGGALPNDEAAEEYRRCYVAHADRVMTAMTTVYEPAAAVLATMRARGVGTAIVSTKYRYRIESILEHVGLAGAVDVIVGGEDVTRHKPDPEGLRRALVGLGVDGAEALYVGDHPVDGHAAARAGVRFVRVLTGEDFGDEPWAGIRALATVADVGALPSVLDRL
ncbi:MAG TPA: HAD-IA family hydrolase [Vicinamibacterales bacterium]|jgi:phosphoglycolate phosphatase|nr:HAD-IA family hydrolase [Vicinamibacterales bacterium]